jgi:hypothetical protein
VVSLALLPLSARTTREMASQKTWAMPNDEAEAPEDYQQIVQKFVR